MTAYYNEIDRYAAEWLRNLITAGAIARGDVDERSIRDVRAADLAGYTQCHFFAGIGIWSAAFRQAGWPDDRPVWSGSCPCQPLSAAGKRLGAADERHLWPDWFKLIEQRRPLTVFGEQVASKDGLAWLDIVQSDLENARYASGAVDLCAAGVGAPHIRQRLWFVAYADGRDASAEGVQRGGQHGQFPQDGRPVRMADTRHDERTSRAARGEQQPEPSIRERAGSRSAPSDGPAGPMGDTLCAERRAPPQGRQDEQYRRDTGWQETPGGQRLAGPVGGFWAECDWLPCTDGKARPVESGTFPLAYGDFARMGRMRAFGNAINQQAAAEFIAAAWECRP